MQNTVNTENQGSRAFAMVLWASAAVAASFAVTRFSPQISGGANLYTVLAFSAAIIAVIAGAMSLVRYYSKKSRLFLYLGVGFSAIAMLEGVKTQLALRFIDLDGFKKINDTLGHDARATS